MENEKKIKESYKKDDLDYVRGRLEELFDSTSGYLIIATPKPDGGTKLTDLYWGVCHDCIMRDVTSAVQDAQDSGLLARHEDQAAC